MIGSFDVNPSKHVAGCSLVGVTVFSLYLLSWIIQTVRRSRGRMTPLRGPPRKSLLFGIDNYVETSPDSSVIYEQWAREYGSAYRVPSALGSSRVILADPKAVAAYFDRETFVYVRSPMIRRSLERWFGTDGVLSTEGEIHKRQRRALIPAFNNAAIREYTPIFFESAYKTKAAWDALIDSAQSDKTLIDIQYWMKNISFDTIGIVGFSYDFRTLNGESPDVRRAFDSFSSYKPSSFDVAIFLMAYAFPIIDRIPSPAKTVEHNLSASTSAFVANMLVDLNKIGDQRLEDKSMMGPMLKNKDLTMESRSPSEEVLAQMKLLLLAGYETTSIILSWALAELAQKPDVQTKLREELSAFSAVDPTWDQLATSLPYLDAVVHEILRLHTPLPESLSMTAEDDILPLSTPIQTSDGKLVNSLAISKGTIVAIPLLAINRSEKFWGPDAKEFKPERWLTEAVFDRASELRGYHHLLTFSDGPRTCLGKGFALAEFKAVIYTLIRNFSFEMPEGEKIEISKGFFPHPKAVGQEGVKLPLHVRRVE